MRTFRRLIGLGRRSPSSRAASCRLDLQTVGETCAASILIGLDYRFVQLEYLSLRVSDRIDVPARRDASAMQPVTGYST